jgi:hypothetical protein
MSSTILEEFLRVERSGFSVDGKKNVWYCVIPLTIYLWHFEGEEAREQKGS